MGLGECMQQSLVDGESSRVTFRTTDSSGGVLIGPGDEMLAILRCGPRGRCAVHVITADHELELARLVAERLVQGGLVNGCDSRAQQMAIVTAAIAAGRIPLSEAGEMLCAAAGGTWQVVWAGTWVAVERVPSPFPRRLRRAWRTAESKDSTAEVIDLAPPDRPIAAPESPAFRAWCRMVAWSASACEHAEAAQCTTLPAYEREARLPHHCPTLARAPCDASSGAIPPDARVPR